MQAVSMEFESLPPAPAGQPPAGTPTPHHPAPSEADAEAFVRRCQAPVWRYLRLLGAQAADAEDLLQETFLRFLARHAPDPGAAPLLRTIARGLWVDQQRWSQRRRARERAERLEQLVAAEGGVELTADGWLRALAACRATLTERARAALDLFYRDGLGRTAVGERLGLSVHGARNLLARTRSDLKHCIERRLAATEESR